MPELATTNRSIKIQAGVGSWTPGPSSGMSYTEHPAPLTKASGNAILTGSISWSAKGCQASGYSFIMGGSGPIPPQIPEMPELGVIVAKLKESLEINAEGLSDEEKAKKIADLASNPPTIVPSLPALGTQIEPNVGYTKTKCSGLVCLRKDDKGGCKGIFIQTSTPFSPLLCNCDFSIDSAGQDKVTSD